MPDYTELQNYLALQMELGEDEVFFDEPWTLSLLKKTPLQTKQNVSAKPVNSTFVKENAVNESSRVQIISGASGGRSDTLDLSFIAENTEASSAEFLNANTLDAFYSALEKHTFYQGSAIFRALLCTTSPEVLLVFDAPHKADAFPHFLESNVGQMLSRMFLALGVAFEKCALTYVYKRESLRAPSAMLDIILRQMLFKEVTLLAPKKIVVFGELALRQMFGRDKSLKTFAGSLTHFANVPAVVIHDARQMLLNVALKKETWNVFLPKSELFK